jgi:PAS domain S-box-containing protein
LITSSGPVQARHPRLQQRLEQARGRDGQVRLDALLDALEVDFASADLARAVQDHFASRTLSGAAEHAAVSEAQREARLAEARMNLILDQASEAVISCDSEAVIIAFNAAAARLYGWRPEEVLGRHIDILFEEWNADAEVLIRELFAGVLMGSAGRAVEKKARRSDGSTFDLEVTVSRVEVDGVVTLTGFHRDVSQRKAEQARLVEAATTAEAANRAKTEFLAAMSHEIRTPLNGVLGMAAALETTPLTDLQRRMLGVINDSGQSLMTLLSDILDLSKIEAGHLQLEETPLDLGASLEAVASLYEETARAKNLHFAVEVGAGARGVFLGDPTRIRQVLQNLISNAMKFTEAGSVTVSVTGEPAGDGVRRVRFQVTDTGVGIPQEVQGRLFSRFVQAESSTTRKFGGTGLGLAICRELVGAMGGEIGVESGDGRGSTFWFTLPLAIVAEAEELEPGGERPLRILAAEDNATNQFVLKAILGQRGLEADFVENGEQAVHAVRGGDYDLVLMDLHMPVMDGLTATQAIRALGGEKAAVPIVAVTAEAMPEQIRKCLAAGMDAHVAKPIRPDVLYSVIDEALSRAAAPMRLSA